MFANLPQAIQAEVKHYLVTDFKRAKKIYDRWVQEQEKQAPTRSH